MCELPSIVDVRPLAKDEGVQFKQIAIKDSATDSLQYQQFRTYSVKVQPGQEVYIKAKAAGASAAAAVVF
jgi:hypothetical protein